MDELSHATSPVAEQGHPALPAIQEEREKFKAEVAAGNEADANRLGHLAARHELPSNLTDASGVVLTPRDLAEVRANGPQGDVPVGGRASG